MYAPVVTVGEAFLYPTQPFKFSAAVSNWVGSTATLTATVSKASLSLAASDIKVILLTAAAAAAAATVTVAYTIGTPLLHHCY